MKRLAIVGSGALGQQIAQHARQSGQFQVAGFFDDFATAATLTAEGPVLGPVSRLTVDFAAGAFDELLLAVGYNHFAARQQLFDELSARVPFARFVHASAYVDPSVVVRPGAFISPGCVLDLNVHLGANTFLYPGCVLAHDTRIGSHSLLAPAVRLAGHVEVGQRCFLGIGTVVIDNVHIHDDVRTGAGAVVVRDLTEPATYVGIPARIRQPR